MSSTIGQLATGTNHVTSQYKASERSAPRGEQSASVQAPSRKGDTVRVSLGAIRASVRQESNREILTQFASTQAKSAKQGGLTGSLTFTSVQLESDSGQAIAAMFEELGIDLSESVGVDNSAEATSDRIVDGSTAMFATFARQNSQLEGEDLISAFETTLRESVDAGYGEARKMLEGLGVDDDVIALGEETMGLVSSKFDTFFAAMRSELDAA